MKRAIFIHRSVGHNLIRDGKLYDLFRKYAPDIELSDYDHNSKLLTVAGGEPRQRTLAFPGNNTGPQNYADFFANDANGANPKLLELIMEHDIIILKSCYPNSNIKSDEELRRIKDCYLTIAQFFASTPGKQLVIMTSPPLVPIMTSADAARRARQLANWLGSTHFADNIEVFNFFDALAAPEGHRGANRLRREYRRWLPVDSHPNARASRDIAPRFVTFVTNSASND